MQSIVVKYFLTALFCAFSSMGVGGGGLFTVYLSLFENAEQKTCQGIGLFVFIASSAVSIILNAKKRDINYRMCAFLSLCACAGAIPGGVLASYVPQNLMRLMFGIFLFATSVLCFCKKRK